MIHALDSATPPSAQQVAQAKAAGYSVWSGYLATLPRVGLLRPWTQQEFDVARGCSGTPIAFCSGWDDPAACGKLAQAWNVRLCLDVESGIRGDGPWVQGFLDASGAGLYGNASVFTNRRAPFFILAGYYGTDPKATWRGTPPSVPHGWQYQGTTSLFGASVDLTYLDDWFTQGEVDMTPEQEAKLDAIINYLHKGTTEIWDVVAGPFNETQGLRDTLKAIEDKLNASGSIPADVQAAIKTLASHLK